MAHTPTSRDELTLRRALSRSLSSKARRALTIAVALIAIAFGLWGGYSLSGLGSYTQHYRDGVSEGYNRSRWAVSDTTKDEPGWLCNGVLLTAQIARLDVRSLALNLGSHGDSRVNTGWCIIKVTVVPGSDESDGTAGHVPGCAHVDECRPLLYSREYAVQSDGIWYRER